MKKQSIQKFAAAATGIGVVLATAALPLQAAQAYVPDASIVIQQPADAPCNKGSIGACLGYPKFAQLPNGRLLMSISDATGDPVGQKKPIYKSDDHGTTWQHLVDVPAPAYLSDEPQYAKYTSNWTNTFLYVLPQDVGDLAAGTVLMASVVTGDDAWYREHKSDPAWVPSGDGDRKDMALVLFSSTDGGVNWDVENIVSEAGWQGGSASRTGQNIAAENVHRQVDPIWEPYLMVYEDQLVAYYSDETDFVGFDPVTGIPQVDPANDTASDSHGQILAHRTWDGTSAAWSEPVVDIQGSTVNRGGGKTQIGGGRPGMTNVVPTTDGKWLLTFERWGGGADVAYKIADDPLSFYKVGDYDGNPITQLPVEGGGSLSTGGSPVVIALPDGRLVYNAAGSGDVYVNETGSSTGSWKRYQTAIGSGYSRALQYVEGTGRVVIARGSFSGSGTIEAAEVDLGGSEGEYYRLVNKKTGQVLGTGGNTQDANVGNGNVPDVVLEDSGDTDVLETQLWHALPTSQGVVSLLNKSGGRALSCWSTCVNGGSVAQWVDKASSGQRWTVTKTTGDYVTLRSVQNSGLYLTADGPDSKPRLRSAASQDGSQEWKLVPESRAVSLEVDAVARCLAGKAFIAVRATNASELSADVDLETQFGTKSFAEVSPGKAAYQSFATRSGSVSPGVVSVRATATIDGQQVTSTYEESVATATCN